MRPPAFKLVSGLKSGISKLLSKLLHKILRRKRDPSDSQSNSSSAAATCSVVTDATQPIKLAVSNKTKCSIEVNWVTYEGTLQKYSTVLPNGTCVQDTFSTHPWVFSYSDGHSAAYVGHSALLELLPRGKLRVKTYSELADEEEGDDSWKDAAWGTYQQRGTVLGMAIMAYCCVGQEAVHQATHVVQQMLAGCSAEVVKRMVAAGCNVAIIGRHQVTTDISPHHFMKARSRCEGARDIDGSTRGLGATPAVPTTSCAEENLTMVDDRRYPCESILVHEFGHAVMNLGLDQDQLVRVRQCFEQAAAERLYDQDCYMMDNADEYWAEGTQSWFDATVRTDVNTGINTREKLKQHDPCFAKLLAEVYGDGSWRYPHTAPGKLGAKQGTSCQQQQQQQQEQQQQQQQQQQLQQQTAQPEAAGSGAEHAAGRRFTRSFAAAMAVGAAGAAARHGGSKPQAQGSAGSRQGATSTRLTQHQQLPVASDGHQ